MNDRNFTTFAIISICNLNMYYFLFHFQYTSERKTKNQTGSFDISPHALVEFIYTMSSLYKLSLEHKELLALDALLPCHHPVVTSAAPGLWLKIVKYLGIRPKYLVFKYIAQFNKDLIDNYHTSSVSGKYFKETSTNKLMYVGNCAYCFISYSPCLKTQN